MSQRNQNNFVSVSGKHMFNIFEQGKNIAAVNHQNQLVTAKHHVNQKISILAIQQSNVDSSIKTTPLAVSLRTRTQ